ncbi:MAG: RagB/SusD family nutrient uptake outer membrane protein, partial [Bacteroidales bacterium]|nr:RagB/SusD family nutrient uptake outer membrane protein [Bacteroidales bacterium]
IELWGEGFSYTDLMRLKKNIDRRGGGYEEDVVFNISAVEGEAGYDARIFPIPQSEVEANLLITENNPISDEVMPVEDK